MTRGRWALSVVILAVGIALWLLTTSWRGKTPAPQPASSMPASAASAAGETPGTARPSAAQTSAAPAATPSIRPAPRPVAPKDPGVAQYERMVASFEKDAAAFRARHPVYRSFESIFRNTLVPYAIDGRMATIALERELGLEPDPQRSSFDREFRSLRTEAYEAYGRDSWEDMVCAARGALLADVFSEWSALARLGAIDVTENERKGLTNAARVYTRQRDEGMLRTWPDVSAMFPDSGSRHYKLFVADRAELMAAPTLDYLVMIAGALPPDLEARRREIEQTRLLLRQDGLIERKGYRYPEFADAYVRSLRDAMGRVEEVSRLQSDGALELGYFEVQPETSLPAAAPQAAP